MIYEDFFSKSYEDIFYGIPKNTDQLMLLCRYKCIPDRSANTEIWDFLIHLGVYIFCVFCFLSYTRSHQT